MDETLKKEDSDNTEKKQPKKKEKFPIVIDSETAEHFFQEYAEAMDIDIDYEMSLEELEAFNDIKRKMVRAIKRGHLTFNDDYSEATYHPNNKRTKIKEPIVFHERTGATLKVMDTKKKSQEMAKLIAVICQMTGASGQQISGLAGEDIKVVEAIFTFLMG